MAERLTTRFHGILVKEADVSKIQVITKLGQLEDIMEEYNIKTISQLQARLSGEDKSHKSAVVWRNKYDELKKQMQNIMEKYGIESVEELDKKIGHYIDKIDLEAENDYLKKAIEKQNIVTQSISKDRDTWKRACELACDVLRDINYKIYNEDRIDFENTFYQQAKKENESK